tara:strand:+ start:3089 stop:3733 length:645 start_codon:yes stop_codon:yes gene_type:complete
MKEQPNYYATLSADVRYDNRLKANVKLLFAEINALCNMNAECFASNKYFADLYSKEKGTISGWISQLVKYEYITIRYIYREGTREISHRYIKIINGGVLKISNPLCDKNLKSNTTSINTNTTYSNNKGRFKKPTLIEIANYCTERKNNIDAETFFDFYESKDWKIGKNKMKEWRACVRTWEKRNTNKPQGISKIHLHLQKNMNVKEKLKKQLNQ